MAEVALSWRLLLAHLPRNAALCRGILGAGAMTTGDGPCDEGAFDAFLEECGIWVTSLGEGGPDVLVIGHDGWEEDDLDAAIEARSGERLKVYSQEMVLASIALGEDLYAVCPAEELIEFGTGHPALEHLLQDVGFEWPTTEITAGRASGIVVDFGAFDAPETGLLRHMGYVVGKSHGLPVNQRREILDRVLGMELHPASESDNFYLDQWGGPTTPERLSKLANCIASFVRLKKLDTTRDNSVAIADWETDLAYLRQTYYRGLSSRFRWPDTAVL